MGVKALMGLLKLFLNKERIEESGDQGQPKRQTPESPPLRKVSPEELKEILEAHRKWIESQEKVILIEEGEKADLSGTNLEGLSLNAANLAGADLEGVNLSRANLVKAKFSIRNPKTEADYIAANLYAAKFEKANLAGADLKGCALNNTNFRHANLKSADLQSADLTGVDLQEAQLHEAKLQRAILSAGKLKMACLAEANLQDAGLVEANLVETQMERANLEGADLRWADLTRANLRGANLKKAKLLRAILREADLQDADLSGTTGLLSGQLAGANVSNAKLPDAILKFEGLANVQELSKIASKLFISMLLGCVYSWLTIGTTTDAGLLTNSISSPLPIIGAEIPIVGLYFVAPLILLGLYFYFHLYLQRLWQMLANLPAVFPDGKAVDERAHPWLLNGLVRAYFSRLREDRPPLSHLQTAVSILLAWWTVPVTLLFFWLRYLSRHDWLVTALHIVLLALSIGAAIMLHRLASATLRGDESKPFSWKGASKDARIHTRTVLVIVIASIFSILSIAVFKGTPPQYRFPFEFLSDPVSPVGVWVWSPPQEEFLESKQPKATTVWTLVVHTFAYIGYSPFANLEGQEISKKPPNWIEKDENDISLIKGAHLAGGNMRYAMARQTFLVNADLRGANLEGADLTGADLRGADLRGANLKETRLFLANMWGVHLQMAQLVEARLQKANLRKASLAGANLRGSDLRNANLAGAFLTYANFQEAKLGSADLRGAHLTNAFGLTEEQIESAIVDERTRLPDYLKGSVRKPKSK